MIFEERLVINNFLSISHLDWNIRECNIITGEMASGKSICMKLLYFIYDIFNKTFFSSSIFFIQKINDVYTILDNNFRDVFCIADIKDGEIRYTISGNPKNKVFDVCIEIKDGKCLFKSEYIEINFDKWRYKIVESLKQDDINTFFYVRNYIINDISSNIGSFFPFGQLYFSDLRTLLIEKNTIITSDPHTNELLSLRGTLEQRFNNLLTSVSTYPKDKKYETFSNLYSKIYDVLHIKNIIFEGDNIYLVQERDEKVPLSKCSSGQREIFHLLSFISLIHEGMVLEAKTSIMFIEEPEVHLFPKEQKLFLELLGYTYNYLNANGLKWRFFMTTHSPYLLNVFNNMLFKGCLLKENQNNLKKISQINETVKFSDFNPDKVSAIFLKHSSHDRLAFVNDDSFMQNGINSYFLFSEEIERITGNISDDYNTLQQLKERN